MRFVFFHAKISQCVCSLWFYFLFFFFVLVLGFFQPVDYYCLMLLWLQTVPRNKRKKTKTKKNNCCSQNVAGDALRVAASQSQRHAENDSDRQKPSTARMLRPIALAHPFSITSMSSFIVPKVVSFPFKWSPERRCSPPPFTYRSLCKCVPAAHRCNERRRVENIY